MPNLEHDLERIGLTFVLDGASLSEDSCNDGNLREIHPGGPFSGVVLCSERQSLNLMAKIGVWSGGRGLIRMLWLCPQLQCPHWRSHFADDHQPWCYISRVKFDN